MVNQTYDPYYGRSTGFRPTSIILGDSTTFHAEDSYRKAGVKGEINGLSSRSVSQLGPLVRERLSNPSALNTAVIALGTNGGAYSISKTTLENQVNALQNRGVKKIVFVVPFRDPAKWYDSSWPGNDADNVATFAEWEREIAARKKGVGTADWAALVSQNLHWIPDGIHYNEEGEYEYIKLVMQTLNDFTG